MSAVRAATSSDYLDFPIHTRLMSASAILAEHATTSGLCAPDQAQRLARHPSATVSQQCRVLAATRPSPLHSIDW